MVSLPTLGILAPCDMAGGDGSGPNDQRRIDMSKLVATESRQNCRSSDVEWRCSLEESVCERGLA